MASIERQLQLCLNKVEKWADENGFVDIYICVVILCILLYLKLLYNTLA